MKRGQPASPTQQDNLQRHTGVIPKEMRWVFAPPTGKCKYHQLAPCPEGASYFTTVTLYLTLTKTFISELDLDSVVTYLHAKNEVKRSNGSNVIRTHTHTQCIILELFCYCDLELDPMTFISERDFDIVVTYLEAKNEVNRSNDSEVIIWTDTQPDRQE